MIEDPAEALQPYDHFHYDDSDSFTTENCGIEVSVQSRSTGVFTLWPVKGSDGQAYRGLDNYEFTEHVTNPATGPGVGDPGKRCSQHQPRSPRRG